MTEWPKQIAEFQENWVQQQQKLMHDWLETLKRMGASGDNWKKTADVMERQVDGALDAQKRSLLTFAETMEEVQGAPEAFTQAMKQLENAIEQWAEVQHRMSKAWFDMLRTTAPALAQGEALMDSWDDVMKQTMNRQQEWVSQVTESQPVLRETSPKKTAKRAAPERSSTTAA